MNSTKKKRGDFVDGEWLGGGICSQRSRTIQTHFVMRNKICTKEVKCTNRRQQLLFGSIKYLGVPGVPRHQMPRPSVHPEQNNSERRTVVHRCPCEAFSIINAMQVPLSFESCTLLIHAAQIFTHVLVFSSDLGFDKRPIPPHPREESVPRPSSFVNQEREKKKNHHRLSASIVAMYIHRQPKAVSLS